MHQTPFLSMNSIVPCINPKRAGGGGSKAAPLDVSRDMSAT